MAAKKTRSGPSGQPLTYDDQKRLGRRRIVSWFDQADQRALAAIAEEYGTSEAEAIRKAVREKAASRKK